MQEFTSTLQEVNYYLKQAEKSSRDWHDQIRNWRNLYNGQHYAMKAKQGEERFVDPTYTNTVDLAVGAILANDLEFRVSGWSPDLQEMQDSEKIEKFLSAILQINSERNELHIPYEVLLHFTRDGCACLYTVWDDQLAARHTKSVTIPDPDVQNNAAGTINTVAYLSPPVHVQVIDPLSIFMIPGYGPGRWTYVFRKEKRSILDVELQYGIKIPAYADMSIDQKSQTINDFVDCWRHREVPGSQEIDGQLVVDPKVTQQVVQNGVIYGGNVLVDLETMPGYYCLPFTIGFFKPVQRDDPGKWGHSILAPLESVVSNLEKSINRRQKQITVYSSLPLVAKVMGGRTVNLDPALGAVQTISPDESLEFAKWQGNPPDVEQQIEFLRLRGQQSGFSDSMFGTSLVPSGYGLSQMGDQNRIRLEQPIQHLQMFWVRWAKHVLQLTSHFAAGKVFYTWGRMRGRDFSDQVFIEDFGSYNVRCYVKPEFPNDRTRNHALATQAAPFLAQTTIMETYLGIEQPLEERKKKITEAMLNDPAMIKYAVMAELKEAASNGDNIAALVLQQMSQQGQQQQPQQPQPKVRAPEQLQGVASPTGQPTPQEMGGQPYGQSAVDQQNNMAGLSPQMNSGMIG